MPANTSQSARGLLGQCQSTQDARPYERFASQTPVARPSREMEAIARSSSGRHPPLAVTGETAAPLGGPAPSARGTEERLVGSRGSCLFASSGDETPQAGRARDEPWQNPSRNTFPCGDEPIGSQPPRRNRIPRGLDSNGITRGKALQEPERAGTLRRSRHLAPFARKFARRLEVETEIETRASDVASYLHDSLSHGTTGARLSAPSRVSRRSEHGSPDRRPPRPIFPR